MNASGDITRCVVPSRQGGSFSAHIGAMVADRFPSFETAGLASSKAGVSDVTPDWKPVLGWLPQVSGLIVGYGLSGYGLKLYAAVGSVLAQEALGLPIDVLLVPNALERFRGGHPLAGRYSAGAAFRVRRQALRHGAGNAAYLQ